MSEATVLKFKNIEGTDVEVSVDLAQPLVIVYPNGDTKEVSLAKKVARTNVAIEEMTIDELRIEIRNSHSVFYKSKKKFEDMTEEAKAAFDATKMNEQEARYNAAVALFESKFPGESKTIGSTGKTKGEGKAKAKSTKADQVNSVIESIKNSTIPEEAKAEALAKLEALVASLAPKPKKEKVEAVIEAAEPQAEVAEVAEVAPVANPVEPLTRGRRG
jgi:hypothetical protein